MIKKATVFIATILLAIFAMNENAQASTKTYTSPVTVEVYSGTNYQVKLEGFYLLTNKSTNKSTWIKPNVILTISANNINAGDLHQASTSGFHIAEGIKPAKIIEFTSTTHVRSGAMEHYEIKESLTKSEAAIYLSSFTNGNGETWYNVQTGNGVKGWVSVKSSLIKDAPSLSLINVNSKRYRGSLTLKPSGTKTIAQNNLDIEDYLKGVVPNEMPASWHMEAVKAQAIVARSYAANSMYLKDTTSSQVYNGFDSEDSRSNQAVNETSGLVVKYNGKPIQTFFFSTSGGRTANVGDVWNSNQASFPYLVSVEDKYESSPHSNWEYSFNSSTLLSKFNFSVNTILYDIQLQKTGQNGEVSGVTLVTSNGTQTITGNEAVIRRLFPITGAYGILRSNWFTLETDKQFTVQTPSKQYQQYNISGQQVQLTNGTVTNINTSQAYIMTTDGVITKDTDPASIKTVGKGWGHRIGMSQYGAKGYAENGWKAVDIVKHYFPGTVVSK